MKKHNTQPLTLLYMLECLGEVFYGKETFYANQRKNTITGEIVYDITFDNDPRFTFYPSSHKVYTKINTFCGNTKKMFLDWLKNNA